MPEPFLTTTAVLGGIGTYVSKDAIEKILGPTAEYLGEGLRNFTAKRAENINKIFANAQSKLGDKIESKGEVPPKVLKEILDGGSFSNDPLAIEYLGGVLASSRTELGRDDRGARVAKILDSLSSYQLRTHYIIYQCVHSIFKEKGMSMNAGDREEMKIFIPFSDYSRSMDFSEDEGSCLDSIMTHIFFGLTAEGLISEGWSFGKKDFLINQALPSAPEDGIVCAPSALGTELFLWAFGHSRKKLNYIFSNDFVAHIDGLPDHVQGACATKALQ
jgi:hypothetical protein